MLFITEILFCCFLYAQKHTPASYNVDSPHLVIIVCLLVDEAPVEILARGPEALQAYHAACESGTQPVFRTRLMLLGQDRVGKTSLKKALTGQRYGMPSQYISWGYAF